MHSLELLIAQRIVSKIEQSASSPERHWEKVVGTQYHKIRAGDYRALAVLDFQNKIIEVRRAGHRKNIYKQLKKGKI